MSKVALILSGCGVFDGSEINESVLCLLALSQKGDTYECFAPQGELLVVDHLTRQPTGEKRSILKESARIARGHINLSFGLSSSQSEGFCVGNLPIFPAANG